MFENDHYLFFPVIVLVALILIALNIRVLFRFLLIFLVIIAVWYGLYYLGYSSCPVEKSRKVNCTHPHHIPPKKRQPIAHV